MLLLSLYSFSYGVVTVGLDGTQDFSTIQSAIDFVTQNPNDMIIEVSPGLYQENLLIESDMIIRSSGDANNTIIDGSLGRGLGSTVVIRPKSGSLHKPQVEIDGFGISNGQGTDMIDKTITFPNGQHPIEKNGGGMLIYVNNPKVNNCKFTNNGISSTGKGGAVYAISSGEDSDFSTRDDYEDADGLTPANGPLDLSNNVFSSNDAAIGLSVFITGF
ncbi:MAG: pectinesterase family protein, partial [Candidatus Neomarinimicrobiota bacterium]|nr:pectinesterase family protein [Candidatus Neomarinimicrobiota bacterium]